MNLFQELELWDEVVTCYQLLQVKSNDERKKSVRERGRERCVSECERKDEGAGDRAMRGREGGERLRENG